MGDYSKALLICIIIPAIISFIVSFVIYDRIIASKMNDKTSIGYQVYNAVRDCEKDIPRNMNCYAVISTIKVKNDE